MIKEKAAEAGSVTSHDTTIRFSVPLLTLSPPSTNDNPTRNSHFVSYFTIMGDLPAIAPIKQWVVETLIPRIDAVNTVDAVAICAANPLEYVNFVIFSPIVAIT
jgi:hypothetical protein